MKWMPVRRSTAAKIAVKALYGSALVFVGIFLWRDLQALLQDPIPFDTTSLILSFTVTTVGYLINLLMWKHLTRVMSIELPLLRTARAWTVSRLGRYIPGKIPFFLMRLAEYSVFPKRLVAVAFTLEYFLGLLAACFVVSLALGFSDIDFPLPFRLAAYLGLAGFAIVLYPPNCKWFCNLLLTFAKRDPIESVPSLSSLVILATWSVLVCLIHGLGFFLLIDSISPLSFSHYLIVTGVFFAAGLIGIAVLIAPGGLGVTEGILFVTLPTIIPLRHVAVAAVGIRVTCLISEILLAAIFYYSERIFCGSETKCAELKQA